MPRLQILHHKSYHPYNEKNKQRVREDEAKAAAEELQREQRALEAESEARLAMLRRRAGSPDDNLFSTSSSRLTGDGDSLLERHKREKARAEKKERREKRESERRKLDFDFPDKDWTSGTKGKGKEKESEGRAKGSGTPEGDMENGKETEEGYGVDNGRKQRDKFTTNGHINFWADLEKDPCQITAPPPPDPIKLKAQQEEDKLTMYLSRPERETKPWYTDRDLKRVEEKAVGDEAEERRERERRKDMRAKERNDPLTDINRLLSTGTGTGRKTGSSRIGGKGSNIGYGNSSSRHNSGPAFGSGSGGSRQKTERERALAMMAAKAGLKNGGNKWDDTPSTIGGRTWEDDFERQKDQAGRYFSGSGGRLGAKSWEI